MGRTSKKRYKRKRRGNNTEQLDLETKVADAGGQAYFGLEASSSGDENEDPNDSNHQSGVYGSRRSVASRSITTRSSRRFSKKPASSMSHAPSMGQASTASTTRNPYKSTRVRRSSKIESSVRSASGSRHSRSVLQKPAVHIVCAIGENLARYVIMIGELPYELRVLP